MNYLLDTCVLSEARKRTANREVLEWLSQVSESRLYLSVIALGEIQKGIAALGDEERKQKLQTWLETDLRARFAGRVLNVDTEVALEWGMLLGQAQQRGTPAPVVDTLIAATAVCHNLTLVTRNVQDFAQFPIRLYDPWNGN
jgi:predicted nucleic acid-binding protein